MKHYICTGGCHGVSEMPGVCNTADCTRYKKPMMECKCDDSQHFDIFKKCQKCGKVCDGKCDNLSSNQELKK